MPHFEELNREAEAFAEAEKKGAEKRICDNYEDTDRNSRLLFEAGFIEDHEERDRKAKEWGDHIVRTTGFSDEPLAKKGEKE